MDSFSIPKHNLGPKKQSESGNLNENSFLQYYANLFIPIICSQKDVDNSICFASHVQ